MNKIIEWETQLREWLSGDANGSVNIIKPLLKDDYTFIDIGCNTGLLTQMIVEANPNYKSIHMFEPVNEYYNESVSKFKDYNNIKINNIGLSDKKESVKIKLDSDNLGFNMIRAGGDIQIDLITFTEYATLNNIKDVDFIKIDTEGYDIKVMNGMSEWLSKQNQLPYILFEKGWSIEDERKYCEYMIKTYGYTKQIEYAQDFILIP
jgi:FkbM family methyltransferase